MVQENNVKFEVITFEFSVFFIMSWIPNLTWVPLNPTVFNWSTKFARLSLYSYWSVFIIIIKFILLTAGLVPFTGVELKLKCGEESDILRTLLQLSSWTENFTHTNAKVHVYS